jgi:hypothetical protein
VEAKFSEDPNLITSEKPSIPELRAFPIMLYFLHGAGDCGFPLSDNEDVGRIC